MGPVDVNVCEAVSSAVGAVAVRIAFLLTDAIWSSACSCATADTVTCDARQRTLLAVGAPVILLVGGLNAFVRAYLAWRKRETWWPWQGVGWSLTTLMLRVLATSMPSLAGPAVLGG